MYLLDDFDGIGVECRCEGQALHLIFDATFLLELLNEMTSLKPLLNARIEFLALGHNTLRIGVDLGFERDGLQFTVDLTLLTHLDEVVSFPDEVIHLREELLNTSRLTIDEKTRSECVLVLYKVFVWIMVYIPSSVLHEIFV